MSVIEQEEPRMPGQVNGMMAAGAVLALALLMGGTYLSRSKPASAAAPAGAFATSCWTIAYPIKLKKAGADMDVQTQAFVACVVTDTRTGEVVKEFTPTIPGAR